MNNARNCLDEDFTSILMTGNTNRNKSLYKYNKRNFILEILIHCEVCRWYVSQFIPSYSFKNGLYFLNVHSMFSHALCDSRVYNIESCVIYSKHFPDLMNI